MTDEEIARKHVLGWEHLIDEAPIYAQILAALAAARSEQHAECVRLLREDYIPRMTKAGKSEGYVWDAMEWLESQKP